LSDTFISEGDKFLQVGSTPRMKPGFKFFDIQKVIDEKMKKLESAEQTDEWSTGAMAMGHLLFETITLHNTKELFFTDEYQEIKERRNEAPYSNIIGLIESKFLSTEERKEINGKTVPVIS
jgi:hypothetical protein